ncbi:MAG: tyrosine recombinase XerC [Oscillospiraceae bacterium]|nr:tyrosine recombinase XerC [Oscillospiraceae bacterium]
MDEKILDNAPSILKKFLNYLTTIRGKSVNTALEYFFDIRTFLRYMKSIKYKNLNNTSVKEINIKDIDTDFFKKITQDDIYEFLGYTLNERNNGPASRARKISSLKSFFKYLVFKAKLIEFDPSKEVETPKLKKTLPKFLTLNESIKLLQNVSGKQKDRDYLILTLFLNCGMRLSELVNINLSDIREDDVLKITGKGNKERIVYLNNACKKALIVYRKIRPKNNIKDKDALFLSRLKKRISKKTVQYIVYKHLKTIGISSRGFSVHKLRHTAATLMYQHAGVDIRVLKEILGHENLGTTEVYTHVSNKQIKNAFALNPLSNSIPTL